MKISISTLYILPLRDGRKERDKVCKWRKEMYIMRRKKKEKKRRGGETYVLVADEKDAFERITKDEIRQNDYSDTFIESPRRHAMVYGGEEMEQVGPWTLEERSTQEATVRQGDTEA